MMLKLLKRGALLVALALAALPAGMTSRASAALVSSFDVHASPFVCCQPGFAGDLSFSLDLVDQPILNGLEFAGGSVTLFSGLGTSRTFGIGEGGTTRIFSTFFNYPEGTYTPSFTATVITGTTFVINVCSPFIGCFFEKDFNNLETVTLSGSAELIIPAATPLPAALPLFGTGLGFMGLVGWWRKRRTEMAA